MHVDKISFMVSVRSRVGLGSATLGDWLDVDDVAPVRVRCLPGFVAMLHVGDSQRSGTLVCESAKP